MIGYEPGGHALKRLSVSVSVSGEKVWLNLSQAVVMQKELSEAIAAYFFDEARKDPP